MIRYSIEHVEEKREKSNFVLTINQGFHELQKLNVERATVSTTEPLTEESQKFLAQFFIVKEVQNESKS